MLRLATAARAMAISISANFRTSRDIGVLLITERLLPLVDDAAVQRQ